ncbi:MAG: two-component regulator propeller domain-containing protein [Ferruginibacter sp.]
MRKSNPLFISILCILIKLTAFSQSPHFNLVLDAKKNNLQAISSITQDVQGYIWFTSYAKGLNRYDGNKLTSYVPDNENKNSLASNTALSVSADSSGFIWVGTLNGLDRFDAVANKFTHFIHDPKNPESLVCDTVVCITTDSQGDIWIGTVRGLDKYEKKTAKFIHFNIDERLKTVLINDSTLIAINSVHQDKNGMLWIGWGNLALGKKDGIGGLASLNKTTGKITRYLHNPGDANTISNNNVTTIFEDSRNNLWIGTMGDGLHTFNRETGTFTHYPYDSLDPEKLSGPPLSAAPVNGIVFINEDSKGKLWIGSRVGGINMYDPATKRTNHFGTVMDDKTGRFAKDTLNGFTGYGSTAAFTTKDGLFWISDDNGNVFNINFSKINIPFTPLNTIATSFYFEEEKNILWIGSDSGLLRRELSSGAEKQYRHDPKNKNSLASNSTFALIGDDEGNIWIGHHYAAVQKLNLATGLFTLYKHDSSNAASLIDDGVHNLYFDRQKNLWIGTHKGISKMNTATGRCINYKYDSKDSSSLGNGSAHSFAEDTNGNLWIGTDNEVNYFDNKTGKFTRYLISGRSFNVYTDANGKVWAGASNGLFFFDTQKKHFKKYTDPAFPDGISPVYGLIEDNIGQLWVSTDKAIVGINKQRNAIKIFNADHGINSMTELFLRNIKTKDGRLFLGGQKGFYSFTPEEIDNAHSTFTLQFTNLRISNGDVIGGESQILSAPIWKTGAITLSHNQNTFSFEFNALDYKNPGDIKFLYKLENYDNEWHNIGTENKVVFYNVPHGKYILQIKAINSEGSTTQKSIAITITPPWWKTWWAYLLYGIILFVAIIGIYKYQKHHIIKKEREKTQAKELAQAKEIEKAYTDLKATQNQLIQSEKMASLGELTAGIAHEIQNPLNFVNNFSEVNKELLLEMKDEIDKGNIEDAKALANDIIDNEEKINHHGKRADAIVKGMLQHSRSSNGTKEPTDINALCDEYLRLSYHGLRAKDKSFNATLKTNFDPSIGKINIIPQDFGRVMLNLLNNAFYAVAEKKKQKNRLPPEGGTSSSTNEVYEPIVTVTTRRLSPPSGGWGAEITVTDNGNGIPSSVKDKIFQPFFTTKPTGQGTGLGLSLSYDIITKGHNGELKVETKEGEGTTFIIQLPG